MVAALTKPTRSYVGGSYFERCVGFWAGSVFSAVYVIAPSYLLYAVVTFCRAPSDPAFWLPVMAPLIISLGIPEGLMSKLGIPLLSSYPLRQIPKYFELEE